MRVYFLLCASGGALLIGCGSPVCDKNESLDWGAKLGDCGGEPGKVLQDKASCGSKLGSCSGDDQKLLEGLLGCLSSLPVCSAADRTAWSSSRQACYENAAALSPPCRQAFFADGLPHQDGGTDAGVEALHPMTDGGGALDLVVVADETDFALAWTSSQRAGVDHWQVASENLAGIKDPEVTVPGGLWTMSVVDAGAILKKSFFVAGLTAENRVVTGEVEGADAGSGVDAGGCLGPLDCPVEKVCELPSGVCVEQACVSSNTCPGGYMCETLTRHRCEWIAGRDGGTLDAGSSTDGGVRRPLPFLSETVTASTGAPGFSPEIVVSPFIGQDPEVVAIDSARQYVALEQENQLFGHLSLKRGRDYPVSGARRPSQVDSVGKRIKLAYVPQGKTLYACYNLNSGVRVRRSRDLGQTWGAAGEVVDLAYDAPTDGGPRQFIQDCDIAPWRDGKAVLVVVDDTNLTVRTVGDALELGPAEVAFTSNANVFNAQRPAIATLPDDSVIHIGFTGSRPLPPPAGTDTEVYALYRDPSTGGAFTPPMRINETCVGTGNPNQQDHVSLATDPFTKRAVAAYTSRDAQGAGYYNTVYVSVFEKVDKAGCPAGQWWTTGSDLSAFVQNALKTEYLVIPDRPINSVWDAFSPTLAVTPSGKIFLSFLAGPQQSGTAADYHAYLVPFDLRARSGFGWYVPPAKKMGPSRVLDPGSNGLQPTRTASAADSQLSVYTVYVEGLGPTAEDPNRAIMVTRP